MEAENGLFLPQNPHPWQVIKQGMHASAFFKTKATHQVVSYVLCTRALILPQNHHLWLAIKQGMHQHFFKQKRSTLLKQHVTSSPTYYALAHFT
jgi:hypothetical protein